jgi:hypothetical protein
MLLPVFFMLADNGQAYLNSAVYNPKSGRPGKWTWMTSKVNLLQVAIPLRDRNLAMGMHKSFARIDHFGETIGDTFNGSL